MHDVAQAFYGDEWLSVFETVRKGAFRALSRLRDECVIKAWGRGVNRAEPCELLLDLSESKPDGFLLAGRNSLLDHERALQSLMPAAAAQKVEIVAGGPYRSGVVIGASMLTLWAARLNWQTRLLVLMGLLVAGNFPSAFAPNMVPVATRTRSWVPLPRSRSSHCGCGYPAHRH